MFYRFTAIDCIKHFVRIWHRARFNIMNNSLHPRFVGASDKILCDLDSMQFVN